MLKQMKKGDGRDFFEEAQMEETKRREASDNERRVLSENRGDSEATSLFGVDRRPPLLSQDLVLQRSRCAIYTCQGILEKFDFDCVVCECVRLDLCTCEGCGQPYNPNRYKKCGTHGCGRLFSHHPNFYKQSVKEVKDSTDVDAEKLTADKMKKKIEAIRWTRLEESSSRCQR